MANYMGITNPINILSDIGIYRGNFLQLEIDVVDEFEISVPLDTVQVIFKICDLQDEDIVFLEKIGENSLQNDGISEVRLLTSDTEDLSMSKYRYIIEILYETGNKSIGKGFLTIL